MANYANLKDIINNPTQHGLPAWNNDANQIEGVTMKGYLLAVIDSLTVGYQFMGVATPSTNPGTPDQRVFYIAATPGAYSNFGLTVNNGEVAILRYDTSWAKLTTGIAPALVGYQFLGIATPTTNPGTPDQKVFYLASQPGTYTNFLNSQSNPLVVNEGEVCVLVFGTSWSKLATGAATSAKLTELGQETERIQQTISDFGLAEYIKGYYLNASGETVAAQNTEVTDYIKVSPGDELIITGRINSGISVGGYNANKEFVSALLPSGVSYKYRRLIIPSGISYIRACGIVGLSQYDTPSVYLNTIGKIVADQLYYYLNNQTKNQFVNTGGFINLTGGITSYGSYDFRYTDFIPVVEGQIIFYRGYVSPIGICVAGYSSNAESAFVSNLLPGLANGYKEMQFIIIPSGISYIRVCSSFGLVSSYQWAGFLYSDKESAPQNTDIILDICKLIKSSQDQSFTDLVGKKVVFFGDSITYQGGYIDEFCILSGAVGYNRGVGGTTISEVSSSLKWSASLCNRVDMAANETIDAEGLAIGLPSAPDMVVMFAGINDWGRVEKSNVVATRTGDGTDPEEYITGARFGDFSDEDKSTWCGGVRYVIRRLRAKFPTIPIVVVLPLHTYAPASYATWSELIYANPSDESSDISLVTTQDDNKTFGDYRNAIRYIAEEYGCPVIDTFEIGFTPILAADKSHYYQEGLHPNALGHTLLGKFIYNRVKQMMLDR